MLTVRRKRSQVQSFVRSRPLIARRKMSAWTRPLGHRGSRGRRERDPAEEPEPVRKRDDQDSEEEHEYVFGGDDSGASGDDEDEAVMADSSAAGTAEAAEGLPDIPGMPMHVRARLARLTCDQGEQ